MPRNENARRCPEPRPHPCGCGAPSGVAGQHWTACLQVCEKTFCFGKQSGIWGAYRLLTGAARKGRTARRCWSLQRTLAGAALFCGLGGLRVTQVWGCRTTSLDRLLTRRGSEGAFRATDRAGWRATQTAEG